MRKRVLVLGGNFGGLTAALAVHRELRGDVDVTVVSAADRFVFTPSLIWLPFGARRPVDVTFPLWPTLESRDVRFVHATATAIDPVARRVATTAGKLGYDYLVIATGYRNARDQVPGLLDDNDAYTITTLPDAIAAGEGWRRFLDDPGPVVVGAGQGAGCYGAAYEFLFNAAHQLRRVGLRSQVDLTFVTPEPFLGHFGIGGLPGARQLLGRMLHRQGIEAHTGVAITEVAPGKMMLGDGTGLPFRYAMIIPPFRGQQVIASVPGLTDADGYVPVHDTYRSAAYPDIYAVGVAAAVPLPWVTGVPMGVPKGGFPTEAQARAAARNIAADIRGEPPAVTRTFGDLPSVSVLDAGDGGIVMLADRMLPPRRAGLLLPGPQSHAVKVAVEKYFLWKTRNGYVSLP